MNTTISDDDKIRLNYLIGMSLYLKAVYKLTTQDLAELIDDTEQKIIQRLEARILYGKGEGEA